MRKNREVGGGEGYRGERGGRPECFSSTDRRCLSATRSFADYGVIARPVELIYGRIARGIAFAIRKWKTVRRRKTRGRPGLF